MTRSRSVPSALLVLTLPLALGGCAGVILKGIKAGDRDSAEVIVSLEAHELYSYRQPNTVTVQYMGYLARSPVPVKGGPQPELFDISLTDWAYVPEVARAMNPRRLEVQYLLGTRIIRRQQFPSPFSGPGPIARAIELARRPAAAQPTGDVPSSTIPEASLEISGSLDAPTPHAYPQDLVARIDAGSGPRYLRVNAPPNKLVQLTIDVKSHGDPRATAEVTWWSVELLDEKGRPLPHMEKEMVDVGGEFRHIAEWRFDGSPVIFKLQSGSDAGDTLRIRFEELE